MNENKRLRLVKTNDLMFACEGQYHLGQKNAELKYLL
jgi:hypothetical protein